MQLVGATRSFIRRPFIYTNVKLGIFSAFVAITFFSLALFSIIKSYPDFAVLLDATVLTVVFIGVFVMGILISWGSTFFATQRFLNLNTNELYY